MTDVGRNAMMLAVGFGALGTLLWFSSPVDLAWNYLVLVLLIPLILGFYGQHVRLGNFVIVAHTSVVLIFAIYCQYILSVLDRVIPEPSFNFTVLSHDRLRIVASMNYLVLAAGLLIIASHRELGRATSALQASRIGGVVARHLSNGAIAWIALVTVVGTAVIFAVAPNVIDYPYPLQAKQPWFPTSMIFNGLLAAAALAMISAYFKAPDYRTTGLVLLSRLALYGAVAVTLLVGGGRGGAFSIFMVVILLDYLLVRESPDRATAVFLVFDLLLMAFMFFNWPIVRGRVHFEGWSALALSFTAYADLVSGIIGGSRSWITLGDTPMLGQSLFHWLYAIRLVELGSSRELQTFFNLIPQAVPEVLDGILWSRPLPDAVLLKSYFHHGGGLFVYANAYWNGGALVTVVFGLVLFLVFVRIDIFFKEKPPIYLLSYLIFLVLIPVTTFYGIQAQVRALQFGVIAYFLVTALPFGRRGTRWPRVPGSSGR